MKKPRGMYLYLDTLDTLAFHGVPTMFIAMLEHPDFPHTDFSYMRTGIMDLSDSRILQTVYTMMRVQMERDFEKYSETCEKRSLAGKISGQRRREAADLEGARADGLITDIFHADEHMITKRTHVNKSN